MARLRIGFLAAGATWGWLAGGAASAELLCLADGRVFDVDLTLRPDGVEVRYEHGTVLVPERLVLAALDEDGGEFEPRTEEEKQKLAEGLVPFEGKWMSPDRRRRAIADRLRDQKAVLEDLRAHSEWSNRLKEDTKNFAFESTVPRHIFESYRDQMEAYFQIFKKDWRIRSPKAGKLTVCFYGTRKEFHRTSGASRNVLGYFKFYPFYELNIYYDRLDAYGSSTTMFHEANHYLQKLIDEDFSYPHWPGEALAEYYGASRWDPDAKKLETGLIQEGRLTEVKTDIAGGKRLGLKELISTEGMYEHYTWGWTLVHFLMNSGHAKDFQKFFVDLATGRDVDRVQSFGTLWTVEGDEVWNLFKKRLGLRGGDDVADLEAEWHAYVEDLESGSLRGLELAANGALRTDRLIRAKRLFQDAIEAGSENPLTFYRYGEALRESDDDAGAAEQYRRAIELDPLVGLFHWRLSEVTKDEAEAERLQALAREIDPDADFD